MKVGYLLLKDGVEVEVEVKVEVEIEIEIFLMEGTNFRRWLLRHRFEVTTGRGATKDQRWKRYDVET